MSATASPTIPAGDSTSSEEALKALQSQVEALDNEKNALKKTLNKIKAER